MFFHDEQSILFFMHSWLWLNTSGCKNSRDSAREFIAWYPLRNARLGDLSLNSQDAINFVGGYKILLKSTISQAQTLWSLKANKSSSWEISLWSTFRNKYHIHSHGIFCKWLNCSCYFRITHLLVRVAYCANIISRGWHNDVKLNTRLIRTM